MKIFFSVQKIVNIQAAMSRVGSRSRMSVAQKNELISFVAAHPDMIRQRLSSRLTHVELHQQWVELTSRLNEMPNGATKRIDQWKNVSLLIFSFIISILLVMERCKVRHKK